MCKFCSPMTAREDPVAARGICQGLRLSVLHDRRLVCIWNRNECMYMVARTAPFCWLRQFHAELLTG